MKAFRLCLTLLLLVNNLIAADTTILLSPNREVQFKLFLSNNRLMNGVDPKKINIPLTFLKNIDYKATVISDDPASSAFIKASSSNYSSNSIIKLDLTTGGGFIARFLK